MLTLAAVVPATDCPSTLSACLDAIAAADEPPEELIVVTSAPRPGPAAARNDGAGHTSGDVIVFVDADVAVHRDAFRRIRHVLQSSPDLDAVFGAYDDAPSHRTLVSMFRNLLHHHVHQEGAGPANTFWAGLGAMRRDAFVQVSGFNAERYDRASIEDVELGMRLRRSGRTIELDPRLRGTHLKRWTLRTMVETDVLRRAVPWTALLWERRELTSALNLGWRHRLSCASCLLLVGAAFAGRPRLCLCALSVPLALNHRFYALLWRRGGPRLALGGFALHLLHYATTAAASLITVAGLSAHSAWAPGEQASTDSAAA